MMKAKFFTRNTFKPIPSVMGTSVIKERLLTSGFLVVMDGDRLKGILTSEDIVEKPHNLVLDCLRNRPCVNYDQDVDSILDIMKHNGFNVLPVFKDNEFAGIIQQSDIIDFYKEYTNELEEKNNTLKVLLNQRGDEETKNKENIMANVEKLIKPCLKRLKSGPLTGNQQIELNILESNLNEIISPLINKLSSSYLKLTPTEIQVANFIKHGASSKEIAKSLKLSQRTVDTHRYNIRKKLGIKGKGVNLRTFLLSTV